MTETKTTTRKPRATRAKVQEVETTEEVIATKEVKEETSKKRELTDTTKVTIMNNTMGVYGYRNGNKAISLSDYGDTARLTFEEIQNMYGSASSKSHIVDAYVLILDEDVIEELNLGKLYNNILHPNGVEQLLKNPNRLEDLLPKMPKAMQETVVIQARRRFKATDHTRLTDISIVQAIQNSLGINILD